MRIVRSKGQQKRCTASIRDQFSNERGMALILTLSMLAILSVLGAFALSTTHTELGVTSNFRSGREALISADRILEYAKGVVVTDEPAGGVVDLTVTTTDHYKNLVTNLNGNMATGAGATNEIAYVSDGSGPASYYGEKDAADVLGIYFRVSATGQSSTQRSLARLESTFFAVTKVGTSDDGNYSD